MTEAGVADVDSPARAESTASWAPTGSGTSTTATGSVDNLPGEELEIGAVPFLPRAGATLTVYRVAHDDVLNLRAGSGSDQAIVTTLHPTEDRIEAAGKHRLLSDGSIWYEVEARGSTGWANSRYLTYLGPTSDDTWFVVDQTGGYPNAPSVMELGLFVADVFADPEYSTIQMSVAPSIGDLAEVTYDVIGLGDDSIWGVRLHVFAALPEAGVNGYSLASVEVTDLCLRGGSPDGLCV